MSSHSINIVSDEGPSAIEMREIAERRQQRETIGHGRSFLTVFSLGGDGATIESVSQSASVHRFQKIIVLAFI